MKEYNEKTARSPRGLSATRQPRLSMRNRGAFRINSEAAQLLGVKKGDRITILHDEEEGEWYIHKSNDGLTLVAHKNSALGFHSAILYHDLAAATGSNGGRYIIAVNSTKVNGVKAHAILTSSDL